MDYDISQIKKQLKNDLDKNRWHHTKGVANTAVSLAMRYETDLDKAYIAGLLHDCAKCFPDDIKIKMCKQYNYRLSDAQKANTALIHAGLGVYVAKDIYGVNDPEILSAINWHTTGHKDMTLLEKIIYVADYIEPGRTKQPNLSHIRKMAFLDIDECIYLISRDTLDYLNISARSNSVIDNFTKEAYNYYKDIHDQKEGK